MESQTVYTIRNFGNDRNCEGVRGVRAILSEHYRGRSVSIQFASSGTGILKTVFVDVSEAGEASLSYGTCAPLSDSDLQA